MTVTASHAKKTAVAVGEPPCFRLLLHSQKKKSIQVEKVRVLIKAKGLPRTSHLRTLKSSVTSRHTRLRRRQVEESVILKTQTLT